MNFGSVQIYFDPFTLETEGHGWTSVADKYQGSGFGKEMALAREEVLRRLGFSRVRLRCLDEALGFWEKLGYVEDGELHSKSL